MELYYYTTTDALRFILENGNIFATNIRYMNDSEEYTNGLNELYQLANNKKLVKKWLHSRNRNDISFQDVKKTFTKENLKKCKEITEYYSISFCQKNDLLSQWAIYAKESGVSVKMNFTKAAYSFTTESEKDKKRAAWRLIPKKVCYFTHDSMEERDYKKQAFSILDQLYKEDSIDQTEEKDETWRYLSAFVKRYDFYQEAESRLVFQPTQVAYSPKVKYRPDKNVLKPYLDIMCKNGWPIWEIMIGPGFNQQVVYQSIEHFLGHIDVKAGIKDISDYTGRIQNYLKPYKKELKECKAYQDLASLLNKKNLFKDPVVAKIAYWEQLQQICKSITEGSYSSTLKTYIKEHVFTKSGIVLSKSSIPYIF